MQLVAVVAALEDVAVGAVAVPAVVVRQLDGIGIVQLPVTRTQRETHTMLHTYIIIQNNISSSG